MVKREERSACLEMISELYWGLDNSPIQRDKWGLKTKETQLMSSNPSAALRWGDGRVLEQTNSFFKATGCCWNKEVLWEAGHTEEGVWAQWFVQIRGRHPLHWYCVFSLLGKHKTGNHKPWHFRRFWLWWCENRPRPPWGQIPRYMSGVKMVIDLFQLSSGATYDGTFSKGLPNGIGVIMILSNTNCGFLFWRFGGIGVKVVST